MSKHKGYKCRIVFSSSYCFSADTLARYTVKRYRLSALHKLRSAASSRLFLWSPSQKKAHKRSSTKETSCNILLFYDDDNKYIGITPKAGNFFDLSSLMFFRYFSCSVLHQVDEGSHYDYIVF